MLKKLFLVGSVVAALAMFATVAADSPRPRRSDVVVEAPADYVLNAQWAKGNSQDGGAKGESLQMTDFAYYAFEGWWDHDLSDVRKVRFSYKPAAGTTNSGGSPRISLILDSSSGPVIYLDPAHCGNDVEDGWRYADFVGDTTNCTIYDSAHHAFTSDSGGTAWSKMVAEYPGSVVYFAFLIQDATTGTNYFDRIYLDNAFFTKQP